MYNIKEVPFIDGKTEFYLNESVSELLPQNSNSFPLKEKPNMDSIVFTGDTTLFKTRVYKKEDLVLDNSYMIEKVGIVYYLKIHTTKLTATNTFTYITYTSESLTKIQGLYSVDYIKGILYSSTPLKNIKISYQHSISYYEGTEMNQQNFTIYDKTSNTNIETDYTTTHVYQIKDESIKNTTKEYLTNPVVQLITVGDKYE